MSKRPAPASNKAFIPIFNGKKKQRQAVIAHPSEPTLATNPINRRRDFDSNEFLDTVGSGSRPGHASSSTWATQFPANQRQQAPRPQPPPPPPPPQRYQIYPQRQTQNRYAAQFRSKFDSEASLPGKSQYLPEAGAQYDSCQYELHSSVIDSAPRYNPSGFPNTSFAKGAANFFLPRGTSQDEDHALQMQGHYPPYSNQHQQQQQQQPMSSSSGYLGRSLAVADIPNPNQGRQFQSQQSTGSALISADHGHGPLAVSQSGKPKSEPFSGGVSMRIISSHVESLKSWRESGVTGLFEVFGYVQGLIFEDDDGLSKVFTIKDQTGSLQCRYWEMDHPLPKLAPGKLYRCMGNLDKGCDVLKCVYVRQARPGEKEAVGVRISRSMQTKKGSPRVREQ